VKSLPFKRWAIGALVVLAIAAVLWFAGPLIGLGSARPLESATTRILLIALVLAIWIGWEAARILLERRRNAKMLQALAADSQDGSLSRQEAEQLRSRFVQAMATLRSARLGGKSGGKLLYQLPWYMFIGAPGSGKTTALLNAGLRFPLAGGDGSGAALGGIGGTRNCDWWFTDEAVLIDTAGRYTTQDSNVKVDASAWQTFLSLLKRFRPRQPLNGVLATLSIGDLLTFDQAERERYAKTVRARIDELQAQLGLELPVYILVTKTDLIAGFTEFFATFDAEQRSHIWGATLDLDLKTRQGEDARAGFDKRFAVLLTRLNSLVLPRLQEERDLDRRAAIYAFPLQFAAVGPLIAEFLDAAFKDSRFAGRTLVRGVYFTSGTQQGAPIDRLLGALSRSLSLGGGRVRVGGPAGAAKSFFLARLMTDVVFREANLAGFNEKRETFLRRLNWSLLAVCSLLSVSLTVLWALSYRANAGGLAALAPAVTETRAALATIGPPQVGDLPAVIEPLDRLQALPERFFAPIGEPPLGWRWGLYQGTSLNERIGERYRLAVQRTLLPRLALQLESVMAAQSASPEAVYAALKAYLMLYDGRRLDPAWLRGAVAELWASAFPRSVVDAGLAHLDTLIASGDLQLERVHERNDALVANARLRVASASLVDRAYSLLRLTGGGQGASWRLSEAVGASGVALFVRASGGSLAAPEPYLFTREGYRNLVKDKIRATVDSLSAEEAWVLGERASGVGRTDPNQLTAEVLRRYFADFTAHWDGVLADIRLRKVSDAKEALSFAQALAQPDSSLKRLIVAVNEQTQLGAGAAVASAATEAAAKETADAAKAKAAAAVSSATSGLFGAKAVEAVVGSGTVAPDRVRELQLDEHFAALRRLAGDGKSAEYEVVALTLNEIASDLVAMQQRAASGVGIKEVPAGIVKAKAQADRFPQPVAGMLKQLVGFAESEASGGLQRETKAGVGGAAANCARSIPGRYPFARNSGQDVGIRDFELVFKPGGDLDAFFSGTLAPVVDRSGAVWRFKSTEAAKAPVPASTLRQFQNADAIRTAFFGGGGVGFTADLTVAAADGEVTVDHDGVQTRLRPGSGVVRLVWPAKGSTRILLNGQPLVAADGAWALFRVVDKGTQDPGVTGDRMRLTYTASAGRATVDLRVGSAAFNPFRLRELETFACPSMP